MVRKGSNNSLLMLIVIGILIYLVLKTNQQKPIGTAVENEEDWKWVDWRGKERQITVHRQIKMSALP